MNKKSNFSTDESQLLFNNAVKQVKASIAKFNNDSWNTFVKNLGPTPMSSKKWWMRIKMCSNKKKSSSKIKLKINDLTICDEIEIASQFALKLEKTLNDNDEQSFCKISKETCEQEVKTLLSLKKMDPKIFETIKIHEIKLALKKTNTKTSRDASGLSNKCIKELPDACLYTLANIFNQSCQESAIPSLWKSAYLSMLPKKGDPTSIKNYRPISMTEVLMKLFERIILKRLQNFLEENKILIKEQSGFRKKRGTKDNIVYMLQRITEAFNSNQKVCSIYFDIEAAFDKVWHLGLMKKLIEIKLPTYLLLWIDNFLKNRRYCIKINDTQSNWFNSNCGVPQGAVLSPTLFSLFINDIPLNKDDIQCKTLLFADDILYFKVFKDMDNKTENKINDYLEQLLNWTRKWRISLATHKCSYQIHSLNKKSSNNEWFNLYLGPDTLKQEKADSNMKFLGITFDKRLKFKTHFETIKNKVSTRISILKHLVHKAWRLSDLTLINIYKSLVRSVFDYSLCIFPLLSKSTQQKLESLQILALRHIFRAFYCPEKKNQISNEAILAKSGLQTLENRASKLFNDYIKGDQTCPNELIIELQKNFKGFQDKFPSAKKTLLDLFSS